MADSTANIDTAPAGETNITDAAGKDGVQFEAITSQEELDRIITNRLSRERSKYSDYDDLKAKSQKWDEAEEANKTELQKANERAEKAERAASEKAAELDRLTVISTYGIPPEYHDLVTAGDPEGMKAQAEKIQNLIDTKAKADAGRPVGALGKDSPQSMAGVTLKDQLNQAAAAGDERAAMRAKLLSLASNNS